MARTKIALLYVGGSIGMKVNQKSGRIEPIESLGEIHRFLPELQKEVELQFVSLKNIGSSEVTTEDWVQIAHQIESIYDEFEGFVIVHGTNTMSYTAAALSFALQNLSKPVVLTGALHPINDIAGDGRMNLIYSLRAAALDIAEVCITLGPRVLRGCRSKKVNESIWRTFDSPGTKPLAAFDAKLFLSPERQVRRKRTLKVAAEFEENVVLVSLHPGITDSYLQSVADSKPAGVVLRAYGPGMFPERLFPWLRRLTEEEVPILITSQALRGEIDLQRFRKQLALEQLGVISGKDMTNECALVKMMWALRQAKNKTRLKSLLEKNLVGEMS